MKRRNFLSFGALAALAAMVPAQLSAEDYRATRPDVWTSHTVDDSIKKLYGTTAAVESGVTLTVPEIAANGGSVPISVASDIDARSVAVFQDANPESAVAVFTVHENSIINFDLKIKLRSDGTPIAITAIVEAKDGKLYSAKKTLIVPNGTCDG
jgi:sulfur-oxidizing protein SoxY